MNLRFNFVFYQKISIIDFRIKIKLLLKTKALDYLLFLIENILIVIIANKTLIVEIKIKISCYN